MTSKTNILDAAIKVLRHGQTLTIDSVAREAGLTKPGVVHHFATKATLTLAVVDHVMDIWENDLLARASSEADAPTKLRAYVEFALTSPMDPSDLALFADARLRDELSEQWVRRLDPWFGTSIDHPAARAARFIADGAWFDRSLGIVDLTEAQLEDILAVAMRLINEGVQK
ncbi:TetR/AcrR family transcriptional regulator [Saxibacter everestensis]|uniref:TetR/AcrR family transcriptional regulator n=1 Tax=Saxibacter everestensis TaxID=2909229 RepID=A0ABY8QSW1_9MICO|nr:TetR/AcrR family transcriptional regulator [Brevibacteriaceae bacterium ZFBP1038]